MNYNFNDIDKFLREGGKPEDIAQAFADSLNKAIESNSNVQKLNEKASKVSSAWNEYVDTYFITHALPSSSVPSDFYIKREEIEKLLETFVEVMPWLDALNTNLNKLAKNGIVEKSNKNTVKVNYKNNKTNFDEVIGSFLHDLGL